MSELRTVLDGLSFGESPRWHDGRLWVCDWGAEQLLAVDERGEREPIVEVHSFPFCIDWLPDGTLLIVSARDRAVLTMRPDRTLATYAELGGLSDRPPNNEIVVDGRGHAYVDGGGFDMMAGEAFVPGTIALLSGAGEVRQVADGLGFPNGMAITEDGATLIVAESYGGCLTAFDIDADGGLSGRRVWADLAGHAPDGICLDAEGAVWFADVPNRCCVRVREGGQVVNRVDLDRGCFACMLGGADGMTLFLIAREWHGVGDLTAGTATGQVLSTRAPAPGAGSP